MRKTYLGNLDKVQETIDLLPILLPVSGDRNKRSVIGRRPRIGSKTDTTISLLTNV
jgi:hypothetical protein